MIVCNTALHSIGRARRALAPALLLAHQEALGHLVEAVHHAVHLHALVAQHRLHRVEGGVEVRLLSLRPQFVEHLGIMLLAARKRKRDQEGSARFKRLKCLKRLPVVNTGAPKKECLHTAQKRR